MDIVINYWAVVVGAIISVVLGMIWYNPKVFGTAWIGAQGKSMDEMLAKMKASGKSMTNQYIIQIVSALVMNYVLAHFVSLLGQVTFMDGATLGFWLWLGFVATAMIGMVLWEGKPWKYFSIVAGYHLVNMLIVGGLLAAWS